MFLQFDTIKSVTCDGKEYGADLLLETDDAYSDDSAEWYACSDGDGNSPLVYLVFATSWENAYEHFCDTVLAKQPLTEADLEDYKRVNRDGTVDYDCTYTSDGTPIDDSGATCDSIAITSINF